MIEMVSVPASGGDRVVWPEPGFGARLGVGKALGEQSKTSQQGSLGSGIKPQP